MCMLCANTITVPPSSPQIIGSMSPGSVGRHPLSTRFTARVRVACMTYPPKDQLQNIYSQMAQKVCLLCGGLFAAGMATGVGALPALYAPACILAHGDDQQLPVHQVLSSKQGRGGSQPHTGQGGEGGAYGVHP